MGNSQTPKFDPVIIVGKYAAYLSIIEVALGSILHALKIPLTGNFLSLNQGFLLCRASIESKSAKVPCAMSNAAAILKSLAPAGKKLGPMLSLSAQGLLFTLGVSVFGVNIIGLSIGMVLLSFWTFIQPILTYYLFFGNELVSAIQYLYEKSLPYHGLSKRFLFVALLSLIFLKAFLALCLAILSLKRTKLFKLQDDFYFIAKAKGLNATPNMGKHKIILVLKDLLHPLFLFSLAITTLFLYFSEHSPSKWIWVLMRPIAIGFIFFYLSRSLNFKKILSRMHGTRWENFSRSCEIALSELYKRE